jgi:anti-sigma factor RsiW
VTRCAVFRNLITASVLADEDLRGPVASHAGHCIKCQAHVASLRATRRRLSEIRSEAVAPPAGLESLVIDRLDGAVGTDRSRPRMRSKIWTPAAGAMATAIVAALWMHRRAVART